MLTEQVAAQNDKINDLERLITDKAQHVSTTEDLLQRVWKIQWNRIYTYTPFHPISPSFATPSPDNQITLIQSLIGSCYSLPQERLTRSSLETQKLELMSAMSELKLQQAVLERENLELRASHFNNNTIAGDRRLPPVPNTRIRTNSSSGSMVRELISFTNNKNIN